ncbi:MAG: permease [bacterium]|nr:permease [bacterium]
MDIIPGIILFVFFILIQTKLRNFFKFESKTAHIIFIVILFVSIVVTVLSIIQRFKYSFSYFCNICPLYGYGFKTNQPLSVYIHYFFIGLSFYFITIFPIIITFTYLSVLLRNIKLNPFKNPIIAFIAASTLPVCSCGVFPILYSFEERNLKESISKLIFFLTTPLISPLIVILSVQQLGLEYTLFRILFVIIFVSVFSIIILLYFKFRNVKENSSIFKCVEFDSKNKIPVIQDSINMVMNLFPPIALGTILGTLTVILVPTDFINRFLDMPVLSIFLFAFAGIPIYFCHGADILALTPWLYMGLPVAFSYAFSITGGGICFGSIPLILKTVKTRFVIFIFAAYIILPPLLGILFNIIFPNIQLLEKGF